MNPPTLALCSAVLLLVGLAFGSPVRYDQRQEGDLNVRTDVEDVVFVVVPPQDLVAAGMGVIAATAAEFLKKNYGPIGPERFPLRTSVKGFGPLEKSPYKVDLGKSGLQVKKITQPGDPNRYNFHEDKNPTKAVQEPVRVPENPSTENIEGEMQSTSDNKTVKKDLKPDGTKKEMMESMSLKVKDELEEKVQKTENKLKIKQEKQPEVETEGGKKLEGAVKTEEKRLGKPEEVVKKQVDKGGKPEEGLKVIGEGSDGLGPMSILRHEGCGPDAYRDSVGKCVYKKLQNSS